MTPRRDTEVQIPRGWLRLSDAEKATGISGAEFRKLWSEGRGPRRAKVGRMVLIRQRDLDAWLEAHVIA
jgi:predicted DNA-binding transcriptional regulator AlpA